MEGLYAQAERERLAACVHRLRWALRLLLDAKTWKISHGKDETYRALQPEAWFQARVALKATEEAVGNLAVAEADFLAQAEVLAAARGSSDEEAAWRGFLAKRDVLYAARRGQKR